MQLRNALKTDRSSVAVQLLLGRALLAQGEVGAAEVALAEAFDWASTAPRSSCRWRAR